MKFFSCDFVHGNVIFNFRGRALNDFGPFGSGYHEAGKLLMRKMECAVGYRDFEGYPILFLYRQALELYMKAIIYKGSQLHLLIRDEELDTRRFLKKHRLTALLPPIDTVFEVLKWKWDFDVEGAESFERFTELIKEVEALDRDSSCFRYPVDKRGEASVPKHFVVNVIKFGRTLDPVLELLSGLVCALERQWDEMAEAMYIEQERRRRHRASDNSA